MPIIIDGWNFIRNRASPIRDEGPDALEAAAELVATLRAFQEGRNDPITIVFDSSHEYLDFQYRNTPKLRIVPARNADDYIKRQIDQVPERQRRNLRVVSSDNDIYFYARSSYATPLRSEEFWSTITRRRGHRDADDGSDKEQYFRTA